MPAGFNEIRRHTTADRLVGGFCYSGTMTCVHSIRKWILSERKSTKLISFLNCHHFKSLADLKHGHLLDLAWKMQTLWGVRDFLESDKLWYVDVPDDSPSISSIRILRPELFKSNWSCWECYRIYWSELNNLW